jgi:hypothetical protein
MIEKSRRPCPPRANPESPTLPEGMRTMLSVFLDMKNLSEPSHNAVWNLHAEKRAIGMEKRD